MTFQQYSTYPTTELQKTRRGVLKATQTTSFLNGLTTQFTMPLTQEQVKSIREELDNCKNPLYFFHDDPDGLSSFLLLYRYKKEGNGVIVKRATPQVDEQFLAKVEEYNPDKIFILDIAVVDQGFIDNVKAKVIWIDHHTPIKLENVKIFKILNFWILSFHGKYQIY